MLVAAALGAKSEIQTRQKEAFETKTSMSRSTEYRASGALIGCIFLVLLPVSIAGPALFGTVSFAALPEWVLPFCAASAVLGAWHIATAIFALDEDLEFITGYAQTHEAAVLILPFVLFVGTRSMYRRLFMPAFVAQQRWAKRRAERLRTEALCAVSELHQDFVDTVPL